MSRVPFIRVDLYGSLLAGDTRHAQQIIKDLGIKYKIAIPQSMIDAWDFWGCTNIPNVLPEYVQHTMKNPRKLIGFGLSEEEARALLLPDIEVEV